MKKLLLLFSTTLLLCCYNASAQSIFKKFKDKVKEKADNKVDQKVDNAATKTVDAADDAISGKKKKSTGKPDENKTQDTIQAKSSQEPQTSLKVYNNFDFVPGDKILFEDNFRDDQDGEFASHWKLEGGQGVVNTQGDDRIFAVTKYYTSLSPLMKTKAYLPDEYTIEFDTWLDASYDSNPGIYVSFKTGGEQIANIRTNSSQFDCDFPNGKLSGQLPKAISYENYHNKWHHIAIAVKGNQLKVYCDQYRVLVVPDKNFKAATISIAGDASEGMNMLFKNFKLAAGGGMNMLGKKFTDSKIITHGINFDYNKATIKPESMGTLNMIVQIMNDNPEIKFEIGGHTDADGDDGYNLKLSQQRADAVKKQLTVMGISEDRLSTKGYGETKPISDNSSIEGKANNRRVEFSKK